MDTIAVEPDVDELQAAMLDFEEYPEFDYCVDCPRTIDGTYILVCRETMDQ